MAPGWAFGVVVLALFALKSCNDDTGDTNFTITSSTSGGGSIAPSTSLDVGQGARQRFTLTPFDGYQLDKVDSTCGGKLTGDIYITAPIYSDCSVIARFGLTVPKAPHLSMTPQQTKTFAFNWDDLSNENQYLLYENSDGNSGFTQIATISNNVTTYELEKFLPTSANAEYILSACNDKGCTDSSTYTVNQSELKDAIGYIKASNTDASDEFGYFAELSKDGETLAIGAINESSNATGINGNQTNNATQSSGAVYIFRYVNHAWQQEAYIKASNTDTDDIFGHSLSLSEDGSTLVVGAPGEDSAATGVNGTQNDESSTNSGAAYVFTRDNNTWSQQAYLKASNTHSNDEFGWSLALSADGNRLAVSAYKESSNTTGIDGNQADTSFSGSGAVYIFNRDSGNTWSQDTYIKASNTGASDQFGYSIALSNNGNTLAVGARYEDSDATGINGDESNNAATGSGAVYVFNHDGNSWSQEAYLKASNTESNDSFGASVELSANGNTLAIGAPLESSGSSVINNGQMDNSAPSSGASYVFVRSGTTWSQQAYLKASNTDANNVFGWYQSMSSNGDVLAIAAVGEKSATVGINGNENDTSAADSGAVYLFERDGITWVQQSYIKPPNTEASDLFGFVASLSANGDVLAIGSRREDSASSGINSDQQNNSASSSGAVYLY
ncbi:hypothetical protein BZG20_02030 [Salinivibrio sp. IB868]|uniref:FG-GAP repeat protein n=1 Tax=unclassified Salinivibrio TaxID=2636825 RepID=UPI0009873DBC|nr:MULTISPECIES: FG-GAP repeat protein [unclassified Salinivibrio]OOE69728.1 hypothetical protein BZG20_02030 [Salinivibrio sp. IB868]OOE73437.1 hypothetical protein BZG22_09960 [Salinivibrio sp. IB870]